MFCQAIIQSGPRRGQLCGRVGYNSSNYCLRYHYDNFYEQKLPVREEKLPVLQIPQEEKLIIREKTVQITRKMIDETIAQMEEKIKELKKAIFISKCKRLFCCESDAYTEIFYRNIRDDCAICTTSPEKSEYWCQTKCGHFYHPDCISGWIKSFLVFDKGCPVCRTPVVSDNLTIVLSH